MRAVHRLEALEVEQSTKDQIDRGIQSRGYCVGGFAQVEFILADFVHKVSRLPEYTRFGDHPHRFESRVKRVREIATAEGVIYPYREELKGLLEAIETWEEVRHYFVHGWMDVHLSKPSNKIRFRLRRFKPTKIDQWACGMIEFSPEELNDTGQQISELANQALQLFDDIYRDFDLERDGAP